MAEVNTLDLTTLAQDLQDASDGVSDAVQQLLEQAGNEIAAEAQNNAPVRTGKLRDSIAMVSGPHRVYVGPDVSAVPYANYVEYGTAPHVIRPANARALRFQIGGTTVFARSVKHPGTKAHPYMRPAAQKWVESLGEKSADVGVALIMGDSDDS